MGRFCCETEPDGKITLAERVLGGCGILSWLIGLALVGTLCGCAYKGGKVVDGTNIAIGIRVPGTEWCLSVVDYVGGVRVAGNDATCITVSNEVSETNSYFGCVTTQRRTRMAAYIEPVEEGAEIERK